MPTPLARLVPPAGGEGRVALDGQVVGGLTARYAEWRAGVGRLVATGEGPWSDTTAVFPLDADGRVVAPVDLTTGVRVVGLPIATVRAQVTDWDGSAPVPLPGVVREDQTLRVTGGAVEVAAGLTSSAADGATVITLPVSLAGLPEPDTVATGVRDLLGALLGADLSRLVLELGDTGSAAAVVTGDVGLVPPGTLPPTSPATAGVLDAVARAWLGHRDGPVDVTASRADPTPHVPAETGSPGSPTLPTAPVPDAGQTADPGAAPEAAPEAASEGAPSEAAAGGAAPPEDVPVPSGEGEAVAPIELLMPPAPAEPGPAQVQRMGAVGAGGISSSIGATA
ncbi:MAG: hypothetical protein QMC84_14520, partial [Nocardioides sp.]|nr:hypothetical protein [Nocardioides sp.]